MATVTKEEANRLRQQLDQAGIRVFRVAGDTRVRIFSLRGELSPEEQRLVGQVVARVARNDVASLARQLPVVTQEQLTLLKARRAAGEFGRRVADPAVLAGIGGTAAASLAGAGALSPLIGGGTAGLVRLAQGATPQEAAFETALQAALGGVGGVVAGAGSGVGGGVRGALSKIGQTKAVIARNNGIFRKIVNSFSESFPATAKAVAKAERPASEFAFLGRTELSRNFGKGLTEIRGSISKAAAARAQQLEQQLVKLDPNAPAFGALAQELVELIGSDAAVPILARLNTALTKVVAGRGSTPPLIDQFDTLREQATRFGRAGARQTPSAVTAQRLAARARGGAREVVEQVDELAELLDASADIQQRIGNLPGGVAGQFAKLNRVFREGNAATGLLDIRGGLVKDNIIDRNVLVRRLNENATGLRDAFGDKKFFSLLDITGARAGQDVGGGGARLASGGGLIAGGSRVFGAREVERGASELGERGVVGASRGLTTRFAQPLPGLLRGEAAKRVARAVGGAGGISLLDPTVRGFLGETGIGGISLLQNLLDQERFNARRRLLEEIAAGRSIPVTGAVR